MSRVTVNHSQGDTELANASIEDATQKSEIADAKFGGNSESQDPTQTFTTKVNNMHCLVVEEEHDMSQYLTNYGYSCYRLTHRNADSGAANGLLTKIKNR